MRITGKKIYLSVLEVEHCKILWEEYEYDINSLTETMNIGQSVTKAVEWFNQIQQEQGNRYVRLGIFLNSGKVIGQIALQQIDWKNRSCSIGFRISKIADRSKGYGSEALNLILDYGFNNLGLERITATTLEQNIGAQKSLEKKGFVHEGTERKAVYFAGKKWDRLNYGILREEYNTIY